ncbi:hypothetical protein MSSAC_3349 [Methanosarcina siciliae C2J]|uniref:Uncharacterized protein n=2 Tax=Methanosarcina siciliae TaxID=38027 RepID=A0A0E3P724_9EURY|nr:hypothetical protein [Methanosarcina siciliae]AKB29637.1 hypothetical protein MSSIT_2918 [Methanosarcina siciliae T4/M]AKB37939.1 hypothetical protein MSSAC_3349 [Methanosarcina siciliae C2J]
MSKYKGTKALSLFVGMLLCVALTGNALAAWNIPEDMQQNWENIDWDEIIGNATDGNTTGNSTNSSVSSSDLENISEIINLMNNKLNSTNGPVSPSNFVDFSKLTDLINNSIPENATVTNETNGT